MLVCGWWWRQRLEELLQQCWSAVGLGQQLLLVCGCKCCPQQRLLQQRWVAEPPPQLLVCGWQLCLHLRKCWCAAALWQLGQLGQRHRLLHKLTGAGPRSRSPLPVPGRKSSVQPRAQHGQRGARAAARSRDSVRQDSHSQRALKWCGMP